MKVVNKMKVKVVIEGKKWKCETLKVKEKVANKDEKVKVRKVGPLYFVDQNWWGRQLKAGLPQDKQEGSEEEPSKRKMQNASSMDMLLSQGYYIAWPARRTKPTRIGGWGRRTTWGCKLWRSWNSRRFWEVSEERLRNDWNIAKVELSAFVKVTVFGKDNLLQNFVKTVSSSQVSRSSCPQHHLLDLQHNRQL